MACSCSVSAGADHMHVDRTRSADDAVHDRARRDLGPARPPGRTYHELRRALCPGGVEESERDVSTRGLDVAAAQLRQQRAVLVEQILGRSEHAVLGADVNTHEVGLCAGRDACRPPHQVIASRRSGERHHHALARLPWPLDAVAHAVLRERLVDAIRDPQERELAQRRQVALTEVVAERRVDSLGRVDVAVGHAAPQGFGRRVDELDLVGAREPRRRAPSRAA